MANFDLAVLAYCTVDVC